ncbi:hypothetical protein [Paracidovorax avenae]|uniref:hypothetical protein n=1 Tax=Paracidovorax avenae TaxID=80867 RepID=UPI001314EE08|nr:hypothetical protein [Paracidovorax avenae]
MSADTTPGLEAERAAFEAVFSAPPYEFDMMRHPENSAWPGNYLSYHVHCAWDAWQEGRRAPTQDADGWMPIETAPKDGTPVLLRSRKGRVADGAWITATSNCGGWAWPYVLLEPVEWRKLPDEALAHWGAPAATGIKP